MGTVKLKNGAEEVELLVISTLKSMQAIHPIALYELVEVARDHQHKPWGSTGKELQDTALLNSAGGMHDSIRNIVLSAAQRRARAESFTWSIP